MFLPPFPPFLHFLPCCTGTSMMVDGFAFTNPRCKVYFLTHCHSDHTVGLTNSFNAGTIWCSPVRCVVGVSNEVRHAVKTERGTRVVCGWW